MTAEKHEVFFSFCTYFGVCRARCGGFDTAAEGSNSGAASQDATQTQGIHPYWVYVVASIIRLCPTALDSARSILGMTVNAFCRTSVPQCPLCNSAVIGQLYKAHPTGCWHTNTKKENHTFGRQLHGQSGIVSGWPGIQIHCSAHFVPPQY